MGALMYGTRFANAAGDADGMPINLVRHEPRYINDEWANHVYVNLPGVNKDFSKGDVVTVKTSLNTFTGPVWYIYNAAGSFNLYVHPTPHADTISDVSGGTVWKNSPIPIQPTTAPAQQTVLQTIAAQEEIFVPNNTGNTTIIQAAEEFVDNALNTGTGLEMGKLELVTDNPIANTFPEDTPSMGAPVSSLSKYKTPAIILLIIGIVLWWKIKKRKK